MGTNRLEAFSDGVIAVSITLLVLGLTVPSPDSRPHHPSLIYELGIRWPNYVAYVTSFITIGIIWINHHAMINRLRDADYSVLIVNLLLLMTIGVLPFATQLMATYLRDPHNRSLVAGIYSGAFLLMALVFASLNWLILLRRHELISTEMELEERRAVLRRSVAGVLPYTVATALAPVSAYATLGICAAIALFYAQPMASGIQRRAAGSGP
jgi:uncharacterized membrane protein